MQQKYSLCSWIMAHTRPLTHFKWVTVNELSQACARKAGVVKDTHTRVHVQLIGFQKMLCVSPTQSVLVYASAFKHIQV